MTVLAAKNDPDDMISPNKQLSHVTFSFNLGASDSQVAYLPVQAAFRPASLVMTDYTKLTLEVTASPHSAVKAGTAIWATVTLTSNFHSLASVLTAVRLTASSATTAALAV